MRRSKFGASAAMEGLQYRFSAKTALKISLASSYRGAALEHLYHATLYVPWQPAPRPRLFKISSASLCMCCVSTVRTASPMFWTLLMAK